MTTPCQGTPEKTACITPATHYVGSLNKNLCDECLHYYMEDASPEEQASTIELNDTFSFTPEEEKDIVGINILGGHEHNIQPGFPRPFIIPKVQEKCFEFTDTRVEHYTYTPPKPFRLGGLLVWEPKGVIVSLTIANIEQIIEWIPLQCFEAPFPIDHAHAAIEQGMLEQCLPQRLKGLYFPTCNPDCGTIITLNWNEGETAFKHLMCWGIELV